MTSLDTSIRGSDLRQATTGGGQRGVGAAGWGVFGEADKARRSNGNGTTYGGATSPLGFRKPVSRREARLNAELGYWENKGVRPKTWDQVWHRDMQHAVSVFPLLSLSTPLSPYGLMTDCGIDACGESEQVLIALVDVETMISYSLFNSRLRPHTSTASCPHQKSAKSSPMIPPARTPAATPTPPLTAAPLGAVP